MNATERSALLNGFGLVDEFDAACDERTLAILDRRRRTAVVKRRGWLVRRVLLVADLFGLLTAMALAEWIVNRHNNIGVMNVRTEILTFIASLPLWVVIAKLYGLYDRDEERADHSTTDEFVGVFHLVTVSTFLFWATAVVTRLAHPNGPKLIIFWGAAVIFVTTGRAFARLFARRSITYLQNTVIVGAGDVGQLVAKKLLKHPEYGINLVGFIDSQPKERRDDLEHLALLGGTDRLPALVRLLDVERVIIAFSNETHEDTLAVIRMMKDLDVQIDIVPRLFELLGPSAAIHMVEGLPVVGLPALRLSHSSRLIKRTMDLILASTALLLGSPVLALIAIGTKLDSRGPVFFRQTRMGAHDETFRIWKFRTMVANAEETKIQVAHLNKHLGANGDPRMFKIVNDPRVTRFGKFLRRTSLDELPQLFNVLCGQMSLVGPRPLILDEDQHVTAWARQRLNIKPGITGPWQVMGRDDIPFNEMVRLDYMYVTGWSAFDDLKLIIRTAPVLFRASAA